jgi:hypothetical protein
MTPPPGLESVLPLRDGRPGKCFEDAEQIVIDADPDSGLVLVHGTGSRLHSFIKKEQVSKQGRPNPGVL